MKNDFICIVAGYKDEVNKCFFAFNQGLNSRFPIRFNIEGYNAKELFEIFRLKVHESKWSLDSNISYKFFVYTRCSICTWCLLLYSSFQDDMC